MTRDKVEAGTTETLRDTTERGSEPEAADILDTSRRHIPPAVHAPLVGGQRLLGQGVQLVQGRFRIGREIGRGGTGVVYEAWDAHRAEKVALKTLSQLSAAGIYGLKNEFRALPHVTHANLVRLHELFAEDEQWFFTMDLIEGEPFDRWVRPDDALDEQRLRSGLRQLLDAMSAIHGAGKLHRDLKPSNVLVTVEGRLVVLDFGLTSDWQPESIGQTIADNVVGGTPGYMAPEQAAGMPATPASDYYALGVMLFEALTGSLPFPGEKRQVLEVKQRQAAPWPRATTGDLPEDLVSLCVQLLSRNPMARPQGAALKASICADDRRVAPADAPNTANTEHRTIGFIGRQAELVALRGAYQTALSGAPALVVVSGESGIGKTALCEAFLEELRGQGRALVLAGRCYERERVPFKAFDVLIDELSRYLRRLPATQATALLPEDAFALARLFPVLNRVDVIAEAPIRHIPEPSELRRRAFGALGELFGRLRDRHPLTLFIDDAQWLDHDSAVLFRHLLIERTIVPLLVVVGQRSSAAESLELIEWVLDAARSNHKWAVHALPLGPLPSDTSHALALRLLRTGTADDPATVERLAQTIAHESRGSPFFAGELARFALLDGPDKLGGLSLSGVLDARVDSLPVAARRILQVVALAGQPLPVEVVCDAGAASHSDLDILRAAHLVRGTESANAKSIACYHDQIRENVCSGLSEAQCQGHWRRLSESLSRREDADQELLCRCFEGVGNRTAAAHCAALAADRAATALAFDHSATLYRRSLDLSTPVGVDRLALLVRLGDVLASSGRGQEAAEVYQDAARLTANDQSVDLRRQAAEQLLFIGRAREGTELLRAICDEVGVKLPVSPSAAAVSVAWTTLRIRLRGLDAREHAVPASAPDTLRLRVAHTAATGLSGYLPMQAASIAAKYLLAALDVGDSLHLVQAMGFNAYAFCQIQPKGSWAPKLRARMEAIAQEDGRPELLGFARLMSGTVAFYGNSFREARAHFAHARKILQRCPGVAWELDSTNFHDQFSAQYCGDYADIAGTTPSLIDEAIRRGRVFTAATLSGVGGAPAWLTPDDPEGYRRQIAEAKRFWPPSPKPQFPDYLLLMGEIMLSLYADQPASGFDLLEQHRPAYMRTMLLRSSTTTQTWFAARTGFCAAAAIRAVSSHGRGSRDLWFGAAQRSLIALRRLKTRISLALAEGLDAALALVAGNRDQAAERLRDSLTLLDGAGLGMHAAAARRRLGHLLGGDEGSGLLATGDGFMQAQNVVNREAITELCCPGCRT